MNEFIEHDENLCSTITDYMYVYDYKILKLDRLEFS